MVEDHPRKDPPMTSTTFVGIDARIDAGDTSTLVQAVVGGLAIFEGMSGSTNGTTTPAGLLAAMVARHIDSPCPAFMSMSNSPEESGRQKRFDQRSPITPAATCTPARPSSIRLRSEIHAARGRTIFLGSGTSGSGAAMEMAWATPSSVWRRAGPPRS